MQGLSTARDRGDPVGADGLMGQRSARAALIYLHAREERGRAIADGIDKMVISVTNVGDRWAGRLPRQTSRPPRARRAIGRTEWHATGSQACWPSTCDDLKAFYQRKRSERATGIEPAQPAWKAGALPLSYARLRP